MKNTLTTLTAGLLLAGILGTTALAQSRPRGDRDHDGIRNSQDRYDNRIGKHDHDRDGIPDRYDRHDHRRHVAVRRYHAPRYIAPRNYRYVRWNVGARLPVGYYGSRYYIDYRPYRLPPPPRDYRWTRVGNDVYLVSIRSGLVRDVIYSIFY